MTTPAEGADVPWTRGPWRVANTIGGDLAVCADSGRAEFPVVTMPVIIRLSVNEANVRLIAAAPDLAEASADALAGWRYIRQVHGDLPGVGWDRVENALSDALAKAHGTPSSEAEGRA